MWDILDMWQNVDIFGDHFGDHFGGHFGILNTNELHI